MKNIILAALLSVLSLPAMAQAGKVFDIKTGKFTRDKDVVTVEFTIGIDGKNLKPTEMWTVTPKLRSGDVVKLLPPMTIAGSNKERMLRRADVLRGMQYPETLYKVRRKDAMVVNYAQSVPWEEWMKNSTLVLDETCVVCSKHYAFTDTMGDIVLPEPPRPVPVFVNPEQEAVKERNIAATAFIDFAVNRTSIDRNLRRNPQELDKIKSTLDDVKNNRDMTFRGIILEGFASPEGSFRNNERLASERVQSLKTYVSSNFGIPANEIATLHTAEDWTGLEALIAKSDIDGKSDLLAIINGADSPDAKEARMKAVLNGAPWRVILAEMMPALRRTDYRVDFTVKEYDVHDSREVLHKNPSLLSHYELDRLAKEYGAGSPEYDLIYGLIEKQFPASDDANLNVAAYKIGKGDYAGAKANLDRMAEKTPAYYTNMGVLLMSQGKYSEAKQAFGQAGNSPEARHNLQELGKVL